MPETIIITDEHGQQAYATLKDLQERCTQLRATRLVQQLNDGDSDPLLDFVFGVQPPSEQNDSQPIVNWSIERCARYWEENREEYVSLRSADKLVGSSSVLEWVNEPARIR